MTEPEYTPQTTVQPTLSDLLTIEPSASIFYSYARELEMSSMLSKQDSKLTLFVPTNKAVMALARKPHQGPEQPIEVEISDEEFHNRAKKHVERWVSAHIVPEYPLSLDGNNHPTLLDGKSISFKPISKVSGHGAEWSRVTLDNGAKIVGKKEGLNGDLYLIDGTISLD
ncbi:FAS1 domain-containing protein [Psilocybe cubensis]|uniref:FAS1 domain-containing protein n=2 Tax=Psilocybe cubensis TaxID=181762 RepID=A0ACB8HEN8_PSICU|nr:FAS1 domain-containing protein [Psilocybe cubensis]KAH9486117.1 FAS1 domain-containing protein [Psilocybe cubensis]